MCENSYICRFIGEHPDDFEEILLREYKIKSRRDGNLVIFNYSYDCDFANPLVAEARGIIIDAAKCEVVCWPFRKFGNHSEYYADKIDWENAVVLEKVDGSIMKLWFDKERGEWQFSTNGMIRAEDAEVLGNPGLSYFKIVKEAENFKDIPFSLLSKDKTYIFELVSPLTQVIVNYPRTMLYHIGTRSNISGLETNEDIGIIKPKSFPLHSLEDCIAAAVALNEGGNDEVEAEGYVVLDKNFNRVKVKSPDYIMMHKLKANGIPSKSECIDIILNRPSDIEPFLRLNLGYAHIFKYYDFRLEELKHEADIFAKFTRALYREYSLDRGAVARVILKHPLSSLGFMALDRQDLSGEELLMASGEKYILRLINDYVPNDGINNLF